MAGKHNQLEVAFGFMIALVGFDKKAIRDVFYASAAARGEAPVDALPRQKGSPDDRRS